MLNNVVIIQCASVALADGTNAGGRCESLSLDGKRVMDIARPLRASDVLVFARGNREKTVSFRILTSYATMAQALAAAFAADDALPDQDDLVITLNDGAYTAVVTLPGAGWSSIKIPQPNGLSVAVEYTVTGGVATVTLNGTPTTPAYPLPLISEAIIDPLVIPPGTIGSVGSGQVLCAFEIDCNGELDLDPTGQVYLLTH